MSNRPTSARGGDCGPRYFGQRFGLTLAHSLLR